MAGNRAQGVVPLSDVQIADESDPEDAGRHRQDSHAADVCALPSSSRRPKWYARVCGKVSAATANNSIASASRDPSLVSGASVPLASVRHVTTINNKKQ
jgi:hypothetical protein